MKNVAKITLLVLGFMAILSSKSSYTFWANNINVASSNENISLVIGTWITEWENNIYYEEGQIVLYEGNYYIATRDDPKRGPGQPGGWNFWDPYN